MSYCNRLIRKGEMDIETKTKGGEKEKSVSEARQGGGGEEEGGKQRKS